MQGSENVGFRARASLWLDQVVESKTFRNLLLISCGVGFIGLATSISAAALADYRARAAPSDQPYSSSTGARLGVTSAAPDVTLPLPVALPVNNQSDSDIDLNLAVTTDNPALVIAGAAKSVLREDGKRYRVTVTVESSPTETNEGKL